MFISNIKKIIRKQLREMGFIFEYDLHEALIDGKERQIKCLEGKTKFLEAKIKGLEGELDVIYQQMRILKSVHRYDNERIAVYTVITGGYDELRAPDYVDEQCDYYCITDNQNLMSDFWQMIYITDDMHLGSCKLQRYVKVHPWIYFPEYQYTLYLDGKMTITKSLLEYITLFSNDSPLLAFKHPDRDCSYEEGQECIRLKKDIPESILHQLEAYQREGLPSHYGMIDSAVLFRKHHDPDLQRHHAVWWEEIKNRSRRDQLSFGYACWKTKFQYDVCPLDIYNNRYFECKPHN